MLRKALSALLLVSGVIAFSVALHRDICVISTHYGGDLRNRIVGARLISDGLSPYLYKWKKGDPVRYYDPGNYNADSSPKGRLSVITATPLLHRLIAPLAEMPQSRITVVWLAIEYALWIGTVALLLPLAHTVVQRSAVVIAAAAFLFSSAWKIQVEAGQYYLMIPFLAALVYRLLPERNAWAGAAAGILFVVLVGIRPNCLLLFLPFGLVVRRFSPSFLVTFVLAAALTACVAGNAKQRSYWQEYRMAVNAHIRVQLAGNPFVDGGPDPDLPVWEGIIQSRVPEASQPSPSNERGNVFMLFHSITHRWISLAALSALCLAVLILLCAAFLLTGCRKGKNAMARLALFGYCLYMVTDLFSPVARWQYYTVQWLCPLLLALAYYESGKKWFYALLLTGYGLNLVNLDFTDREHTAGEYLMLAALLLITFTPRAEKTQNYPSEPMPAGGS